MQTNNQTFQPKENDLTNSIAWVGYKDRMARLAYTQGFVDAANLLLITVHSEEQTVTADTLIYPACYLVRHAVELYLKNFLISLRDCKYQEWERFSDISNCLNVEKFGHDINGIWECFKNITKQWDNRFTLLIENAEPIAMDIVRIDNTGETFRYSVGINGDKHLAEFEVIGLNQLRINFQKLVDHLQQIDDLFQRLIMEYSFSSRPFTKKLSRNDLFKIAKTLPKRNDWEKDEFSTIKEKIKREFDIGSKEFTEALDKIQGIWETASMIGMPPKGIVPIDYDCLNLFVKIHHAFHPDIETDLQHAIENNGVYSEISFGPDEKADTFNCGGFDPIKFEQARQNSVNLNNRKGVFSELDKFNIEQIAQLSALYYFTRSCSFNYSEEYNWLYETKLEKYKSESGAIRYTVDHLLRKPDFKMEVNKSLRILKQNEI
jgi:hypothetical protein